MPNAIPKQALEPIKSLGSIERSAYSTEQLRNSKAKEQNFGLVKNPAPSEPSGGCTESGRATTEMTNNKQQQKKSQPGSSRAIASTNNGNQRPQPTRAVPEPAQALPEQAQARPEPARARPEPTRARPEPTSSQANQESNTNVFNQLVATLEAEHRKLKGLEQRRLRLTEEMQNLREMLHQENRKLRTKPQEPPNRQEETTSSSSSARPKSIMKTKPPPRQSGGRNRNAKLNVEDSSTTLVGSKLQPQISFETSPCPLTGRMVIQQMDNNSALLQICSVHSSALWHTPVRSVGLETYLQKSNMLTEARSSAQSSDEHQPSHIVIAT